MQVAESPLPGGLFAFYCSETVSAPKLNTSPAGTVIGARSGPYQSGFPVPSASASHREVWLIVSVCAKKADSMRPDSAYTPSVVGAFGS